MIYVTCGLKVDSSRVCECCRQPLASAARLVTAEEVLSPEGKPLFHAGWDLHQLLDRATYSGWSVKAFLPMLGGSVLVVFEREIAS